MSDRTRRDELLDAALAECVEHGYSSVGVREITTRASVSHGTFYNYFDNRRQMLDVLLDREFGRFLAVQDAAVAKVSRPYTEESLRTDIIDVTADLIALAFDRIDVLAFILLDVPGIDAQALARQIAFFREAGQRASVLLEFAVADGLIDENVNLEFAQQAWVSCILGVIAPVVAGGNPVGDTREVATILADSLLYGVPIPAELSAASRLASDHVG